MTVTAGPSATSASKSLVCEGADGTFTCLLTGVNANTIGNGVVATLILTLSSSANLSRSIQVSNPDSASLAGDSITTSATGGVVSFQVVTPVGLSSLTCNPSSITGAGTATCTVTLNKAAPTGGIAVALSDNSTFVTTPASVTVAAGASTATFTASASAVAANSTALLTASLNGTTANASLALVAPAVPSTLTCSPSSILSGATSTCTVTLNKAAPAGGLSVSISDNSTFLNVPASVTVAAGGTTAAFTATAGTVSTDTTVTVTAAASGTSKTASVSVVTAPAQISGLVCSPSSILSGATSTCTVTLNKVAPTGGVVVAVSDNSTYLTVPLSVTVAAGSASAAFTATAGTVSATTTVTVSATANGTSKTASVSVTSSLVQLSGLACNPASVSSGTTTTCTVTLSAVAPAGGSVVSLSDDNVSLTVPASVTIAAGATTGTFSASAGTIASAQTATVTAVLNGSAKTASVSLTPPVTLTSLVCAPTTLSSGASGTCTVTLSSAAAASLTVAVSDNSSLLTVPASVTVLASTSQAVFTATAATISTLQAVTVTATLSGVSRTASLSLTAAARTCPCSVWDSDSVSVLSAASSTPIQLGMKFRSKVPGYVLGVRFYKPATNVGTHVGRLWSAGGTLLASVNFSGETASGWQQANFSVPVAIAANRTYVVSYTNSKGTYSSNTRYFQTSGVTNGPLYALRDGEDGSNSVYGFDTTKLPTTTYKAGNYWVDIVFNTVASPTQTVVPASISSAPATQSTTQRAAASTESRTAASTEVSRSLSCAPKTLQAGDSFTCQLQLGGNDDASEMPVFASSSFVRIPVAVQARAQQRVLTFHGSIDKATPPSTIAVTVGDESDLTEDQIDVLPSPSPVLSLPGTQIVKVGQPVSFQTSAQDPDGLPVQISVSSLPAGAVFHEDSDRFEWSPTADQQGDHTLSFTAMNSSGYSSDAEMRIVVDSGQPEVATVARAMCSPGAVGTLQGRWLGLVGEDLADPSGSSLELGGTKVYISDGLVPVLFANQTRVDFLCPTAAPETGLEIKLDTPSGTTTPVQTTLLAARPELLRAPNLRTQQALATIGEANRIAMIRDYHGAGEPAQPDDLVSFQATGLGVSDSYAGSLFVKVGDIDAQVESVVPSRDAAGIFLVQVRIPAAAPLGNDVPVRLELVTAEGQRLASNTVTLAIE